MHLVPYMPIPVTPCRGSDCGSSSTTTGLKNLASERWTRRLQEDEIITLHKAMVHFDFEDFLHTALCELAQAYGT
ncbi:hypothetical protein QQZ08_010542 [Neonectria magnoliae]|uniref:Uncharacterized protein n=1 Tax=Neonectria magnoliae TaxID=2732573 RepID=A0ABR1HG07_9HYPO